MEGRELVFGKHKHTTKYKLERKETKNQLRSNKRWRCLQRWGLVGRGEARAPFSPELLCSLLPEAICVLTIFSQTSQRDKPHWKPAAPLGKVKEMGQATTAPAFVSSRIGVYTHARAGEPP